MSRLERLPQSVRREILRYLLLSSRVLKEPDHLMIEHYGFNVDVLRVNGALKAEAETILYGENRFVKIISNFTDAKKSMLNHEVPFFKLSGRLKFKYHVAEISAQISQFNQRLHAMRSRTPKVFLILLEDIHKYTRLLRILDLANFMAFEFRFSLQPGNALMAPLSAPEQSKLLKPFKHLRGGAMVQTTQFEGSFEPALIANLQQAMTQKVAWLRAGVWELYSLARSIKHIGDHAFKLQNADMAVAKYEDAQNFMVTTLALNHMMRGVDKKCEEALYTLEATITTDLALLFLSGFVRTEIPLEGAAATVVKMKNKYKTDQLNPDKQATEGAELPKFVPARYLFLLGVAELVLEHPIKAGKAFAQSYKFVTDDMTRKGHEAAKAWWSLDQSTRTAKLKEVVASCPKSPLAVSDMVEYSTPEVASEHWVMRALGYKGSIPYAHKIKPCIAVVLTTKSHPNHHNRGPRTAQVGEVKEEVLREHVSKYRQQMALPAAQGRLIVWVGLDMDQIGENTILDEPNALQTVLRALSMA